MNIKRKQKLHNLELILKYQFQNIELLDTALRHSSYINEQITFCGQSNERLEFLGDAVLELIISDLLFQLFPKANEGQLSKFRSSVVNKTYLAAVANKLKLGYYLLLGRGEEIQNGRNKSSILANAIEAIIAAIFLDSNINITKQIIENLFIDDIKQIFT